MFPGLGRIHCAPFSDEALYQELHSKAAFWMQTAFYGIDISPLHSAAVKEYFAQACRRVPSPLDCTFGTAALIFRLSCTEQVALVSPRSDFVSVCAPHSLGAGRCPGGALRIMCVSSRTSAELSDDQ